jgi:predicted nucleic acid-binding protein
VILLDTDVLIDVALNRQPHANTSGQLLSWLELHAPRGFVAWHSLSNFYYLVRPARGGASVRSFLVDLTRFVSVAPADTDALRYAATLQLGDFEDAMQVAAARACGAEVIATRNVAHFRSSPIPARTPSKLLAELG